MRNQQWNALCDAWNQADRALAHYKPHMFTAEIHAQILARENWLGSAAAAARHSANWLRLLDYQYEEIDINTECEL